jgi:hypothetical protein
VLLLLLVSASKHDSGLTASETCDRMPSKASKRVRKHRETQSLKSKQQGQQQNWQDLLAEELQGEDFTEG